MAFRSDFMHVMESRGFLADCTNPQALDEALLIPGQVGYIGFDATAPSLHVGSLIQIMMLRWFQKTGHRPITLMGGGTTRVGDPSFRSQERPLLSFEQIQTNIEGIKKVFSTYIDYDLSALMLDNSEWINGLNYLDFIRDIGRHFSVNRMLAMESVKKRLEENQSFSFLEFNYMVLQAYDFLELNRHRDCILQIGGSDQWGNITNGIDLTRRVTQKEVYGITSPLLENSNGEKMGKTQSGAIWLDSNMLLPYEFWQFWRNIDDVDVLKFLKLYTELPLDECERLGALEGYEINEAKIRLATEVTALLHGVDVAESAARTAKDVFEKNTADSGLPTILLKKEDHVNGVSVVKLITMSGLVSSGKEAKRLIADGGARLNDKQIDNPGTMIEISMLNEPIKLSAGKKRHILVRFD